MNNKTKMIKRLETLISKVEELKQIDMESEIQVNFSLENMSQTLYFAIVELRDNTKP